MSAPTWKRHLRFRWSLLILFTLTVGCAIGVKVRHKARKDAYRSLVAALFADDPRLAEQCLDLRPELARCWWPEIGTSLHLAAALGSPEVAGLLIRKGANVNAVNDAGRTPLHRTCEAWAVADCPPRFAVARVLIRGNADVNAGDDYGETPLHFLFYLENASRPWPQRVAIAKLFIDNGANLRAKNVFGDEPLQVAANVAASDREEVLSYAAKKRAGK